MTYRQLVEYLEERIQSHKLVNQYNFGNISDIETPENGSPDYPYVFLRPVDMQIAAHNNQFSFELILMDYVFETAYSYIDGVSRMTQILADIVEDIRSNQNREIDIDLSVTATPFKERFKDSVVGVTAQITIVTAEPLDGCNNSIQTQLLYVDATQLTPQVVGQDVGENKAFSFTNEIVDIDNTWYLNKFTTQEDGDYKIEINYVFQFVKNAPTDVFPLEPRLRYFPAAGGQQYIPSDTSSGWPTSPQEGVTYTVKQVWNVERLAGDFEFVYMEDQAGEEADLHLEANAEIKIYKLD